METEPRLQELKTRLLEINDLSAAASVLQWDQTTYMPPGGAPARGRQIATLTRLAHERFTDPVIGQLLSDLLPYEQSLPYDSNEASLIRETRRSYERSIRLPPAFVAEISAHAAASYAAWVKARPDNNFAAVQPYLERTVELSRQMAEFFPGYEHIADPLIAFADYGMKASSVRTIFSELRNGLVPLVQAITEQPPADASCLNQYFPEDQQLEFGMKVIRRLGYDFERGRQDKTHHPFMIKFSHGDVRITTRVKERFLGDALFSSIHETGHALYEQGIDASLDGTPLNDGTSSGIHESQSRLWENIVGRSRGFWQFFYPQLQATFPSQLGHVPLETFYRAINRVERSLIRTDADEVTYNLHVIIRFDLELALLEGSLTVADLPAAWNERYQTDLGLVAPDNRDGVLQDVHWFGGLVGGAFQGYTLGNILSAQFYAAAKQTHPEIEAHIAQGEFATLHGWLQRQIYCHGSKFIAPKLIERVTGGTLQLEPYMTYLRTKYSELYQL